MSGQDPSEMPPPPPPPPPFTVSPPPLDNGPIAPSSPAYLPATTSQERGWAIGAHLSFLAAGLIAVVTVVPLAFVPPLIVWLVRRGEPSGAFSAEAAREATNFHITLTLLSFACIPFCFILIGFFMLGVLWLASMILAIMAAIKASNGEQFRYPFALRLVK